MRFVAKQRVVDATAVVASMAGRGVFRRGVAALGHATSDLRGPATVCLGGDWPVPAVPSGSSTLELPKPCPPSEHKRCGSLSRASYKSHVGVTG